MGPSTSSQTQEPEIPLIVDTRWTPGPFKGWLPEVTEITALEKNEDVCSALLESARLPLVFERGSWMGRVALDGGVADLTPLLPVLEAGCELIFVIYLDHKETPTIYKAQEEFKSRYRWNVCRSLSKKQAVELYRQHCDKISIPMKETESFPKPQPPFRVDAAELVFVVPKRCLGRVSDFTGDHLGNDSGTSHS
jgi:hypothetical protein